MERLVVGRPRMSVSPRENHAHSVTHGRSVPPPHSAPQESPLPPQESPCPPPSSAKNPSVSHRRPFNLLNLTPSSPLFSLFGREIFGEDLLLLLLILLLIEENADKLLIGALVYVFLG